MQIVTSDDKVLQRNPRSPLDFHVEIFLVWSSDPDNPIEQSTKMTSVKTRGRTVLEKSGSHIHIEINAWPFLWTVVGAWIWFGVLHLAHIV
jgi:hypothetical protein